MGEGKARFARSGPMTLFLAGIAGNPNPFATRPIHFATPHTYTGGALLFETRSSSQTTPLLNDSSAVVEYGGGLFNVADPDALVGDIPNPGSNWAMELHVLRDKTAPRIVFAGKPKLEGGRARVTGTVSETGTRERARHAMPLQCPSNASGNGGARSSLPATECVGDLILPPMDGLYPVPLGSAIRVSSEI